MTRPRTFHAPHSPDQQTTQLLSMHAHFSNSLKDHTQPKCIAGEHCTGAIFCNTDNTYSPIMFDHRTVSLQPVETGCYRCLLDVLLEFIVCTLRIFGSFPSLFTNMKRSNRGRAPRKESRHAVWLTTSTLKLWNERKRNLGFTDKSNNEFAEALLHGIVPGEGSRSESSNVKWGWLAYTISTVRDICTFAVLCLVTRPFLSLHSCLWRALRVVL